MKDFASLNDLSKWIKNELSALYPEREIDSLIQIIYEYTINLEKTKILLKENLNPAPEKLKKIKEIVSRLKKAEPVQYITGETYFRDCRLKVDKNVLIPRQETEELVEWVISDNKLTNPKILDIGTGSGCIAISLARIIPHSQVWATDINKSILNLARENASVNNVKVHFLEHDIAVDQEFGFESFDIIVSNPPYILNKEMPLIPDNVKYFEPPEALFVDDSDSLFFYDKISEFALVHLKKNGSLFFEINEKKGNEVAALLSKKGFRKIVLHKDINGKDRFIKSSL